MTEEIIPVGIKTDTATFGTGCFWCTEAIFQELKGVLKVTSGYSGGTVKILLMKMYVPAKPVMPNACKSFMILKVLVLMNCLKFSGKPMTRPR